MPTAISRLDLASRRDAARTKIDEIFQAITDGKEQDAMKRWCELAHITFNPDRPLTWV